MARPEVDGVETARGEVGDVRPCLLGPNLEPTRTLQRAHRRRVDDDGCRRAVAHDLERGRLRDERREVRLGLGRSAIWRVAQVERRRRAAGDHVVRDPGLEARDREHLLELEATDDSRPRFQVQQRSEAPNAASECAVGIPRARRMATRPTEREAGDDVSEAAGLNRQVGRLEDDRQLRIAHGP